MKRRRRQRLLLPRRLALWLAASASSVTTISLPLWFLGEGGRGLLVGRFPLIFLIVSLWVACDHAAAANLAPPASIPPSGGERAAHLAPVVGWLTLGLLWLAVFDSASRPSPPSDPVTLLGGTTLAVAGLGVRCAAIRALRGFFSERLVVWPSQPLVTSGLFRWVRHPSYAGWLMIVLGVVILLRSWLAAAANLAVIIPAVVLRIQIEEVVLVEAYGEAYLEYERTVRRLVPYLF